MIKPPETVSITRLMRDLATLCVLIASSSAGLAQTNPSTRPTSATSSTSSPTTLPVVDLFDPARHMRVSEVMPGMTGYGLTVFSGHEIERFGVSVIAVQKNFGPQEDVVLIRCLGSRLEHTGVIAGMSGSPVFLRDSAGRDRMIGAVAYGWTLSKDPIGGVQPIEYMLKVPTTAATRPTTMSSVDAGSPPSVDGRPVQWNVMDVLARRMPTALSRARFGNSSGLPNIAAASRLSVMSTPLMATGVPDSVLTDMAPALSEFGLVPLQAGGMMLQSSTSTADDRVAARIQPGSSLVVPLATGDLDLTALGTCTEVLGNRVYAFGHPFNNEGNVHLPMASGYVSTIIPTLTSSFKLGGMTEIVGTLSSDQTVAIAGELGKSPAMIPVDLKLDYADGSLHRAFHFNIVSHPMFTPLLSTIVLSSALAAEKQLPQYHTLDTDLTIEFENGRSVRVNNSAVNSSASDLFFDVGMPIIAAGENPFERVMVKRISGTMLVSPVARQAQILDVNLPRLKYLPGESLKAFVTYRRSMMHRRFFPSKLQFRLTFLTVHTHWMYRTGRPSSIRNARTSRFDSRPKTSIKSLRF